MDETPTFLTDGLLSEHCRRTGQDLAAVRREMEKRERTDRARFRAIVQHLGRRIGQRRAAA